MKDDRLSASLSVLWFVIPFQTWYPRFACLFVYLFIYLFKSYQFIFLCLSNFTSFFFLADKYFIKRKKKRFLKFFLKSWLFRFLCLKILSEINFWFYFIFRKEAHLFFVFVCLTVFDHSQASKVKLSTNFQNRKSPIFSSNWHSATQANDCLCRLFHWALKLQKFWASLH